jgi:hypothetical protein
MGISRCETWPHEVTTPIRPVNIPLASLPCIWPDEKEVRNRAIHQSTSVAAKGQNPDAQVPRRLP